VSKFNLSVVAAATVLCTSTHIFAAALASDSAADAAYNSGWTSGSNGGSGFGPWDLKTSGNTGFNQFAGHFTANTGANGDLNEIANPTRAWGTFANDSNATESTQIAGAFRDLTGGALATDGSQSVRVRIEHGLILGGSTSANVDPARTGGYVGIVLNPNIQSEPDPFNGFGDLAGQFAFGFRGGDAFYQVNVPSGAPTQVVSTIPFGIGGHEVTITPTSPSTWTVSVLRLSDNQTFVLNGNGSLGGITRIGLINRNAENGNAYFNSLAVIPEPATVTALAGVALLTLRRRK
jgi:hypothetical protein